MDDLRGGIDEEIQDYQALLHRKNQDYIHAYRAIYLS